MSASADRPRYTDIKEDQQLKNYIENLESNLSLNKQILFDTLQTRLYGAGSSDSTTAPQISSRIAEKLLYENEIMQSRVTHAKLEALEAEHRLEKLQKSIDALRGKEAKIERDYETELTKAKREAELKELEVQELEFKNRNLEETVLNYNRGRSDMPVSPLEAITSLQDKREIMKLIVIKLREELDRESSHREELLVKFKNLAEDFKLSCSLLNTPKDLDYLDDICQLSEDRLNFDEWWGLNYEESVFSSLQSSQEDLEPDMIGSMTEGQHIDNRFEEPHYRVSLSPKGGGNEKRLAVLAKSLRKRLADSNVKEETLNVELMNFKRMSGLLYDDNHYLKSAVARNQVKYRALKAKLAHRHNLDQHLEEVEPRVKRRRKGRCISNPLEYTEKPKALEPITTAHDDLSFQGHSELPSVIQQAAFDDSFQDSVLMDVFKY